MPDISKFYRGISSGQSPNAYSPIQASSVFRSGTMQITVLCIMFLTINRRLRETTEERAYERLWK